MWFWLSLGSAILGAVDVILNKKALNAVSPALLYWALFALTIPILIPITLYQSIPSVNDIFFVAVIGSSLTFVFARTLFSSSLQQGLISKILPLTAFGGIFTYIFGLLLLGETLRPLPVLGLFSIIIGSYILNADQAKEDILKPFKLLLANKNSILLLLSIMLGGLTAVFDKIGVINTSPKNPTAVMLIEQILMTLFMTIYLVKTERGTWIVELKQNLRILFLNSLVLLPT